jgi:hypothetical protein
VEEKNIGSSFDSWLREEGIYDQATSNVIKRVLARQVEDAIKGAKPAATAAGVLTVNDCSSDRGGA